MKIKKLGIGCFWKCPFRCKQCYSSASSGKNVSNWTFNELRQVADKFCPYVDDLNYGTGEPIFNGNALPMMDYIADTYPKISQAITTNGYSIIAIAPSTVKMLFHDVDVSVDFATENQHNEMRQHKKAWQWANEALEILACLRVPRSLTTCLTSEHSDNDIANLIEMAKRYKATWRINWFRHAGRGPAYFRLSAQRAWDVIRFLSDKVTFQCLDSIFTGPLGLPSMSCPAGQQSARIHGDMTITAYPFLMGREWSAGNALSPECTLKTIYNSEAFRCLRERQVPECVGCPYWLACRGGCVTRAALHNGGIHKRDDYCPVAAGVQFEDIKVEFQRIGDFVHEGYLCTTIVQPK